MYMLSKYAMIRQLFICLVIAGACQYVLSHHLRHHNNPDEFKTLTEVSEKLGSPKSRRSFQPGFYFRNGSDSDKGKLPYSYKKLDKMINKAILQIIIGDLHPADMLLLKALNYTLEDVMTIREHELSRLKEEEELHKREKKLQEQEFLNAKYQAAVHRRSSMRQRKKTNSRESSFEAYNKQAVYDYENGLPVAATVSSTKLDYDDSKTTDNNDETSAVTEENLHKKIDKSMEPHVVFKIRHDDSEFDSGSDEGIAKILKNHHTKTIFKADKAKSNAARFFQAPTFTTNSEHVTTDSATATLDMNREMDGSTKKSDLSEFDDQIGYIENSATNNNADDAKVLDTTIRKEFSSHEDFEKALNSSGLENLEQRNETDGMRSKGVEEELTSKKWVTEYEGLELVGGDIYRVKPEAMEKLLNYEDETGIDYENKEDDTFEYQNDADESALVNSGIGNLTDNQNLTSYQRLALAQRKDQGQKAIEDIKLRVLAMTGRFNLTANNNQVQRERLTMFLPICQMPRNTDPEAWSDPYSMNMHFQLNLTSGEHVLAAKLRLYKLPQDIGTSPSSSGNYEEEEMDEKKIRISVFFYTKSLKKHRVKKRLMDSIVTPLTSQGSHLALDVRQGLRFWRPGGGGQQQQQQQQQQPQQQQQQHGHSSGGNHGLVVQVEDQEGRPLKPALYIQEPSCQAASASTAAGVVDEKINTSLPFSSEPALVTFAS